MALWPHFQALCQLPLCAPLPLLAHMPHWLPLSMLMLLYQCAQLQLLCQLLMPLCIFLSPLLQLLRQPPLCVWLLLSACLVHWLLLIDAAASVSASSVAIAATAVLAATVHATTFLGLCAALTTVINVSTTTCVCLVTNTATVTSPLTPMWWVLCQLTQWVLHQPPLLQLACPLWQSPLPQQLYMHIQQCTSLH